MEGWTWMCFCLQVEQKASCDDYLSLIYLSIDAVTEGVFLRQIIQMSPPHMALYNTQ